MILCLDVYSWLAQRLCRIPLERPQFVSWVNLHNQFGQTFNEVKFFRLQFLNILRLVYTQYPAARFDADERDMMLLSSPPPVKGRFLR